MVTGMPMLLRRIERISRIGFFSAAFLGGGGGWWAVGAAAATGGCTTQRRGRGERLCTPRGCTPPRGNRRCSRSWMRARQAAVHAIFPIVESNDIPSGQVIFGRTPAGAAPAPLAAVAALQRQRGEDLLPLYGGVGQHGLHQAALAHVRWFSRTSTYTPYGVTRKVGSASRRRIPSCSRWSAWRVPSAPSPGCRPREKSIN